MKKSLCLIIVLLAFSYTISAQEWISMMMDKNVNVHDVQKAFNDWYTKQPKDKDEEQKGEKEEDDSYAMFKRWEWLMDQRTYPSGNRPNLGQIGIQYINYKASKASQRVLNTTSVASTGNWKYAGNTSVPGNGGGAGRINRVRFMPGNSNTIFACAATGGLWVSINGGLTWTTKTDQLGDLSTSDIAIDTRNTKVMYLATGDGDADYGIATTITTIGVLRSTDGGITWNPTGLTYKQDSTGINNGTVNTLAIDTGSTNILIAATSYGLYYTSDSAKTWTRVLAGNMKDVQFQPGNPATVYASGFNGAFYRSLNGGQKWTQITAGLPSPAPVGYSQRTEIGVTPAATSYVYLLVSSPTTYGFEGLYLSTNYGASFTLQSNSPEVIGQQGWYSLAIAVSPTNAGTVIVGGLDNYVSSNRGVNWTKSSSWVGFGSNYVHADIHSLSFFPGSGNKIIVGCDGGVFQSYGTVSEWSDISSNLGISQIYSIGPSASNDSLWISGWQDNGTNISGYGWSQVLGGDGMVCFMDYSDTTNNTMFAEMYDGYLQMSTNGGLGWFPLLQGFTPGLAPWVTRWLQDPVNPSRIFAGFDDVYEDTSFYYYDWNKLSNWGGQISALAVYQQSDKYIYAASLGDIHYSSDGGNTWKDIRAGLPVAYTGLDAIAISSSNPEHVWVSFSGYSDTNKVYYSANAGATWKNISAGLPNLPVNCLLYQKNGPDGLYAGTDGGVFYHDTIINDWISYNTKLPNVMVDDLKFSAKGSLVAATYGRGAWETEPYGYSSGPALVNNTNESIFVYPNPATGSTEVEFNVSTPDTYNIVLFDALGQTMYSTSIYINGTYASTLNLSTYRAGVYFLSLKGNTINASKKIVVY